MTMLFVNNWKKMTKSIFKRKKYSSHDILELVPTNLGGPIGVQNYCGDKYFILFVYLYYG